MITLYQLILKILLCSLVLFVVQMMVLEAEHQNLLSAVKQTQKAIATAIFNPTELHNVKKSLTSRSARSGNGTTPRISGGMAITNKYFKNSITVPCDSTATHGVTGKYNDNEISDYQKLVEKLNFPAIAYTPMASSTVADSTERSIISKKKNKGSPHTGYTDNEDFNHLVSSASHDDLNLLATSKLSRSKINQSDIFYNSQSYYLSATGTKKSALAPLVPLSALSAMSTNAVNASIINNNNTIKKLNAKVNHIISNKKNNKGDKQHGKHSSALDSDDDSDSDEVPEEEEIDDQGTS